MFELLQKLFRPRQNKQEAADPDALVMEKWDADFSDPNSVRFAIKSESAYDAYLHNTGNLDCLVLGLRKASCIAWIEDPLFRYEDLVLDGKFRLDSNGSYAAAGFMFRVVDERTYYSALVSNKGYFRLDVLRNGTPLTLLGWTEVPGLKADEAKQVPVMEEPVALKIIACGSHIVLVINGIWAMEIQDTAIPEGRICFAAACYDAPAYTGDADKPYTVEALLESFSLESRPLEMGEIYKQWKNRADPRSRFHLAETFTAMNQPAAALVQLKKAWEDPAHEKTQRELLLAARLALGLELLNEAEAFIDDCTAAGPDTPLGREAALERVKLLYIAKRYDELIAAAPEGGPGSGDNASAGETRSKTASKPEPSSTFYTLLGNVYAERGANRQAAQCYDEACRLDDSNGLAAKNAANVYELLDEKDKALDRYLEAGHIFLAQDNYADLGILVPKALALNGRSWEAHGLAGKWAFGVEDWALAEQEFAEAERLRLTTEPRPDKDPSLIFLKALLLIRQGKRPGALPLLEEAAALAPDFALFRFRLAETRFLLSGNSADPKMLADLEAALNLSSGKEEAPPNSGGGLTCGWIHNLAAQTALGNNDLEGASRHLEKAARILGEVPAIRVNRGGLYYLQGFLDKALTVLAVTAKDEDPEGMMSNCAGNLLVKAGRFEEADSYYQAALAAAPQNAEYICNRASCLIELGRYGEADTLLAGLATMTPSALNLIAYVAIKKGEYQRAEAACKTALENDSGHIASLLSLGWIYTTLERRDDARNILNRLDTLPLSAEDRLRRDNLNRRFEESLLKTVRCASCERSWRILREAPTVPPLRLFAMPPDDLPAGTCPECGSAYCIACGKKILDPDGRFLCPKCGKSLKLIDEGLKKLVYDWAAGAFPAK
jgi:tetratricopeptide (TPR) repeat protein